MIWREKPQPKNDEPGLPDRPGSFFRPPRIPQKTGQAMPYTGRTNRWGGPGRPHIVRSVIEWASGTAGQFPSF